MTTTPTKATETLWWCATGSLRCRDHLPLPGSAGWWNGNWTMVPPQDRERIGRLNGHPAGCETCMEAAAANPATNAHAAYLQSRVAVARAIVALVEHLDILDAGEDIDRRNWAFAGTFNHAAETISALIPSASARRGG